MSTSNINRPKVVFLQRILAHYRIPFFSGLAEALNQRGIDFEFIYGQHLPGTVPESIDIDDAWATRIENTYFRFSGSTLVWQPCTQQLRKIKPDLIIVEQANYLLVNYLLMLKRHTGGPKLAYFGHGRNMQSASTKSLRERWKRMVSKRSDWWFAYTDLSRKIVADSMHYPLKRLTVVDNAIDTQALSDAIANISNSELEQIKNTLGISSKHIALYCGGMYENKRIDFLLDSCLRIRNNVNDFEVIFIGNGPEQNKVISHANQHRWIHYAGQKYGTEIAPYLKMANIMLMPGLVGLAILDSFVGEAPLFTTDINYHSPEIDYLENGVNGIKSENTLDNYVGAVCEYLTQPHKLNALQAGCRQSASHYTITNMINRFSDGIEACLFDRKQRSTTGLPDQSDSTIFQSKPQ